MMFFCNMYAVLVQKEEKLCVRAESFMRESTDDPARTRTPGTTGMCGDATRTTPPPQKKTSALTNGSAAVVV